MLPTSTTTVPAFWQRLTGFYRDSIASSFILHGNVHDYVRLGNDYQSLAAFLVTRLSVFDLIINVNPAQGITFPIPAHRDLALQLLGVSPGAPSAIAQLLGAGPAGANRPPMGQRELLALITQVLDSLLTTPYTRPGPESEPPRPVRVAVLFTYAELLFPDSDLRTSDAATLTRLLQWPRSPVVGERQHLLLMVAESLDGLHSELRRASARWEPIALPLPKHAERMVFFDHLLDGDESYDLIDGLDSRSVASATGALTLMHLEDIYFRGAGAGGLTPELIIERKQDIIRQEFADVLSVRDAALYFRDIGGYEYLTSWLYERIVLQRQQAATVGGLLLSGPPGTGKTQLAEAIAGEARVPFVSFSLARILGQYVGNSERNLERALTAVLAVAPCVFFIDEIDQVTSRGEEGGNGVDNRVFARLLTFLESPERRERRVLVVGATNRPDLLDPALRSRFDRTAPVLPPTQEDRALIVQTLSTRAGLAEMAPWVYAEVAAASEGWVGRNIRDYVGVVQELAADGLTLDAAYREALAIYVPKTRETAHLTQLALAEVTDLRLVPPAYRQRLAAAHSEAAPVAASSTRRRREGGSI